MKKMELIRESKVIGSIIPDTRDKDELEFYKKRRYNILTGNYNDM